MIKISDTEYFSNDRTIRFLNMDCNEFMKTTEYGFYDLAIVDPPYGISVNMNAGRKKDTKSKKRTVKKWDNESPNEEYFNELFRVSKNQIIFGANNMIDKIKINSQGWIFWDKCVAAGCSFSDGELAWTSFNQSLKKIVVPWSGFIGMEDEKFHPTTKPKLLYRKLFSLYGGEKYKMIDTHGGSMNSAIAANMEGLSLDICEIDSEYFGKALKRFDMYERQMKLF